MAEGSPRARILLVEDESLIGLAESRLLRHAGYEVELALEGESGVRLALESRFDLVLMDINLGPGIDGGLAARRIKEGGGPLVVFLSSHSEETAVAQTKDSGAYGYIAKGSGDRILLASLRMALGFAATLGESDRLRRLLAENVGDVIWTLDPSTLRFTYVSPSITALRGLSVEEALAESLEDSMTHSSLEMVRASTALLMGRLAAGDSRAAEAFTETYEQPCKGGGVKWVQISTKPVLDAGGALVQIAGVSRDVTARVLTDLELKKALADKDRLYSELQHRVKNSLALIISLLSLEAGNIEEEEARLPLEEAQVRVRSIGLLYEQLYRTRSVNDIDLGAYLAEVAQAVVESPLGPRGLRLEVDCESIRIATDRAMPAGLLLYELTANAIKRAFPEGRGGRIRLGLRVEAGWVRLSLEDDGKGLGQGFDLEGSSSLGSLLISQLSMQLGGSASARPGLDGAGAGFVIRFPKVPGLPPGSQD